VVTEPHRDRDRWPQPLAREHALHQRTVFRPDVTGVEVAPHALDRRRFALLCICGARGAGPGSALTLIDHADWISAGPMACSSAVTCAQPRGPPNSSRSLCVKPRAIDSPTSFPYASVIAGHAGWGWVSNTTSKPVIS
jgi:hypothetical protein